MTASKVNIDTMSESNEAFEYFSSRSSDKSRGGEANFYILDKVDFVSNALDLDVCTDWRRSESGVNNYNHVSPGEKKEDDYRNRLVKVVERLSILAKAANLRRTASLIPNNSASYEMVTTRNRRKHDDLIRRYCSKCKLTVADVSVSTTQLCAKCGILLDFQCVRCDKLYSCHRSLLYHLESICNRQNLDLKCPKCDYQTHAKSLMIRHKYYCLGGIIHSCSHCKYTTKRKSDFNKHRQRHLKDNDIKAHGDLVAIGNTPDIADGKVKDNMLTTTGKRQSPADLITRYCSKCKITVSDVSVSTTQLCAKCGTLLDFQCIRCDKLYSFYNSLLQHLYSICNRQNLDLKCPKCDYRSHAKSLMSRHRYYCLSQLIYSCNRCTYTTKRKSDFNKHRQRHLKDNDIKAHGDLVAIGNTPDIADGKEKDDGYVDYYWKKTESC